MMLNIFLLLYCGYYPTGEWDGAAHYTLQLHAFSNKENAIKERDKFYNLLADNTEPFIQPIWDPNLGRIFRLKIGRYQTKAEAQKLANFLLERKLITKYPKIRKEPESLILQAAACPDVKSAVTFRDQLIFDKHLTAVIQPREKGKLPYKIWIIDVSHAADKSIRAKLWKEFPQNGIPFPISKQGQTGKTDKSSLQSPKPSVPSSINNDLFEAEIQHLLIQLDVQTWIVAKQEDLFDPLITKLKNDLHKETIKISKALNRHKKDAKDCSDGYFVFTLIPLIGDVVDFIIGGVLGYDFCEKRWVTIPERFLSLITLKELRPFIGLGSAAKQNVKNVTKRLESEEIKDFIKKGEELNPNSQIRLQVDAMKQIQARSIEDKILSLKKLGYNTSQLEEFNKLVRLVQLDILSSGQRMKLIDLGMPPYLLNDSLGKWSPKQTKILGELMGLGSEALPQDIARRLKLEPSLIKLLEKSDWETFFMATACFRSTTIASVVKDHFLPKFATQQVRNIVKPDSQFILIQNDGMSDLEIKNQISGIDPKKGRPIIVFLKKPSKVVVDHLQIKRYPGYWGKQFTALSIKQ